MGLKTNWLLPEFCWPLGNMLPAALLKIITFNAINPLTPRSVEHVTSPYNIHTLSRKEMLRILKLITEVEVVVSI